MRVVCRVRKVSNYNNEKPDRGARPSGAAKGRPAPPPYDERQRAIANYLSDMTSQLESMARSANLELLAYLLAMARMEADSVQRKLEASH